MRSRGSILLAVIFVILISFIGISLLTFSYMHNKISAARTKKVLETEKIFQDLIYYLHHFRETVFAEDLAGIEQPETDYFNNEFFPDREINGTLITNSFAGKEMQKQYYRQVRVVDTIAASGAGNNYAYRAQANIDILSGQIPLTMFPVFINKKIDSPIDTYLKEKKIVSKDGSKIVVDELEAKLDMSGFLTDALDIDKGRIITWQAIREKFGFEISSDPIAEGIHILFVENTVNLIFIQGDVERLVFSIKDNMQNIGIRQNEIDYKLSYEPGEYQFHYWETEVSEYSLFKEKIVINGNALSIEQSGEAAFLESANIVLFVSGAANIRSKLESRNIDLRDIELSNLTLLSSSKILPGSANVEPGVVIDAGEEVKIQAAIIADGKVTNLSPELNLSGSLYARELENEGVIEAAHLNSKFDAGQYFTTGDCKFIKDFFINFIEEVYDEN